MHSFIPFLKAVGRGEKLKRDLSYDESVAAMELILRGEATDAQIGAFLIAQRVKGESADEIRGFVDAVRLGAMHAITPRVENLLDLATPYDGKAKTAQLAPAIALTLVAAGVPVLLHGDTGVPTKEGIGPGPVLDALGWPTELPPRAVESLIESTGFGYLSASQYVPAWRLLTPLRRQFGLRTALNTAEKFFNPAHAPYQISGFFHANYIDRVRAVGTGTRRSWMVQGEEGSIEMAVGRNTPIFAQEAQDDIVLERQSERTTSGVVRLEMPRSVDHHAALNRAVLRGAKGDARAQVVLTAGAILWLLEVASDLSDGQRRANQALDSGAAHARLHQSMERQAA